MRHVQAAPVCRLLDVEPGGFHADGHGEVLDALRLVLVDGHVDAVETCVRAGEHLDVLVAVDGEFPDVAVVPLQKRKPLHGHAGRARDELQQLGLDGTTQRSWRTDGPQEE